MKSIRRSRRHKISTTIAPEYAAFLKALLKRGQADTLAEAVDKVIAAARRSEARAKLESATETYFASLCGEDLRAENELGNALAEESGQVNFDE